MEQYQDIRFNCNAKSGKTHSSPLNINNRLAEKQKQLEEVFQETGEKFVRFERNKYGQLCVVYTDSLFENSPEKCVRVDSVLKNRKVNGHKNESKNYIDKVQQHATKINVDIIKYLYHNNQKCIRFKCRHFNSKEQILPITEFLQRQSCGCVGERSPEKIKSYRKSILQKAKELQVKIVDIVFEQKIMITYKCLIHPHSLEKTTGYWNFLHKNNCGCNELECNYNNVLLHAQEINCDIIDINIQENYIKFNCNKHNNLKIYKCSYQSFMNRKTCGCKEAISEYRSTQNIRYTEEVIQQQAEKLGVQVVEIFHRKDTYKNYRCIKYQCLIHNRERVCSLHDFMRKEQCGCYGYMRSKGEQRIKNYCQKHNIYFEDQKQFKDCRNIIPLYFDFYLPDYNMCIEYNGRQHYNWNDVIFLHNSNEEEKKKKFIIQQHRDNIKREYCQSKDIRLVEIGYWDFDNIEKILGDKLGVDKGVAKIRK